MAGYPRQDVAEHLGVSPVTLGSWTELLADFLSPGARPSKKVRERSFTLEDLELLEAVIPLAEAGVSVSAIQTTLRRCYVPPDRRRDPRAGLLGRVTDWSERYLKGRR